MSDAKRRKLAHSFKRVEQKQAGDERRAKQCGEEKRTEHLEKKRRSGELGEDRVGGQLEEERGAKQLGEERSTEQPGRKRRAQDFREEREASERSSIAAARSGVEMVLEELAARLNDREYKNWLKAGRCLLILKDGLHPFTDNHVRAFHGDLLNQNALLRLPCQTSSCKPSGNKLSRLCRVCSEWQKVILTHHRQPDATINWANCCPPYWRTDHWELAKAYMPRGQAKVKSSDQCDASALLNLINYCKYFWSVDPKLVRQVIQYRNELMHSCEFRVKDEWMRHYRNALKQFVKQFSQVPQMAATGKQIEDMLSVDLSICVSGVDRMDSAALLDGLRTDSDSQLEMSAELISQWETELLQEMLQECLHAAPEDEDDDVKTQDTEQLKRLGGFLQANKDLRETFSTQLQAISSLEAS